MRLDAPVLEDRTHFLLLTLLSFLILFVPLRRGDLSGYDDAVYAHQAKEMVRTGDWWNVRFNGDLSFDFPPMFIWMEALSLATFGLSDFAAKVPAAATGFGTIVLVYYLARELTDDLWVSRLAMFVLVSTQFFMRYATHAMTDVPFAFFCTLCHFPVCERVAFAGLSGSGRPASCLRHTDTIRAGNHSRGYCRCTSRRHAALRRNSLPPVRRIRRADGFSACHLVFGSVPPARSRIRAGARSLCPGARVRRKALVGCGMNWGNSWSTRSSWRRDIGPGCRSWPWDYTSRRGWQSRGETPAPFYWWSGFSV